MRDTTKQNLKIAALAWLTIGVIFGSVGLMDWARLDGEKWLGFMFFTGLVFGCVLYGYARSLKRTRCLLLFVTMLVVHVAVLSHYLRPIDKFPSRLFFLAPFEAATMAAVLVGAGGARVFRRREHNQRRHEADHDAKFP
jgi:hypothetical protein